MPHFWPNKMILLFLITEQGRDAQIHVVNILRRQTWVTNSFLTLNKYHNTPRKALWACLKARRPSHHKQFLPHTTICVQPWSVNVFSHMFIFQTRQFPRQLYRLGQWKCFVWSTKQWMFVKETWYVLLTWSACSINLTTCFQGFGSLVPLRLQKDGRAKSKQIWTNLSHWNTDGLSSRCENLLFFNLEANVQLLKRDIVTTVIYYYTTTEFHYAKRDSCLSAY